VKEWKLRRPSPAFVVSCLALFVALSGSAVALQGHNGVKSDDIAKGAVHAGDIANNAIKSAKIADESVTGADVNESTLDGSQIPGIPSGGGGGGGTPSGPAGGALSGDYPNPSLATNAVPADGNAPPNGTGIDGSTKLAPNSVNFQEIGDNAVHTPGILNGAVTGPKLGHITTVSKSADNVLVLRVDCPAGSVVLSGGAFVGNAFEGMAKDGNGWIAFAGAKTTIAVEAYCLD
jgi:hypothetical protein